MGLRSIAVQEPGADTSKDGWEIYFGLSGLMGQQFRKMSGKKTHTALESRAKAGRHTGGRTYGYTSAERSEGSHVDYKIEPTEAAIVAEIFERYANGESQHAIAADLNARAVPTTGGKPWKVSAIHAMLHNERYIGRLIWNRTLWRKDPDSGRRICVERPESEWIRHTDERLRLVPDATWSRVRSRDAPIGSSNARPKYPLSGLLLCGECGSPMTICGGVNARGYGSHRYVCSTFREHGESPGIGCSNGMSVSRAVAEELLIEPLRARLMADPNFLTALGRLEDAKIDPFAPLPAPASPAAVPPSDADLDAKLAARKAAEIAGIMSGREAVERARAFQADHERAKAGALPADPASLVASAEALRAALVNGAVDALRAALRRTLGTVRVRPVTDDGARYLNATFDGGDMPLLTWLAVGEAANQPGLSALVAGARL